MSAVPEATISVIAVWLPEPDAHVIDIQVDDGTAIQASYTLSLADARALLGQLAGALKACRQLPGGRAR